MNPERFQQVDRVLQSVLERPAAEREAFLDETCGSDASLKHEVRSLLAAYADSGSFIQQPIVQDGARLMEDEKGARDLYGNIQRLVQRLRGPPTEGSSYSRPPAESAPY